MKAFPPGNVSTKVTKDKDKTGNMKMNVSNTALELQETFYVFYNMLKRKIASPEEG